MPVEGFVTVVPVEKMSSRKPQTLQSKEPRVGRAGDWGLRDPSPSTSRLRSVLSIHSCWSVVSALITEIDCDRLVFIFRSKSSRRDESPYCVKSIVPPCESSQVTPSTATATTELSNRTTGRKTHSSPASVKLQPKTKQSKSSPAAPPGSSGSKVLTKNSDVGNNKGGI